MKIDTLLRQIISSRLGDAKASSVVLPKVRPLKRANISVEAKDRHRMSSIDTSRGERNGAKSKNSIEVEVFQNGLELLTNSLRNKLSSWRNKNWIQDDYLNVIQDLNRLQSNTQAVALAKYKNPKEILPLFARQLELAGIQVDDLNRLNIVHISGTKGKGSTCAFIESILRASKLKTGFYNSPHLVKVTERIKINGYPIGDVEFSKYFRHVHNRLLIGTKNENISMPSYFSFLTILAFHIFLEEKVDCAVIEVGIGGEYDPTNIIQEPIVCGITTLDIDHTNILGNSIESIAWSKAGIAKKDAPLFVIEQDQSSALEVIRSRAQERGSPLYICKPADKNIQGVQLGIKGSVQYANAALACQISKYFLNFYLQKIRTKEPFKYRTLETDLLEVSPIFLNALASCSWPGRCQVVKYPRVAFYLDGAHTRKSMENCLDWFLTSSRDDHVKAIKILMVNIIGERNKQEVLKPLAQYVGFDVVIFSSNRINSSGETAKSETFINTQSSATNKSLENVQNNASIWRSLTNPNNENKSNLMIMSNTSDCIKFIGETSKRNPNIRYHVLVTGSLHFVGAVSETLPNFRELLS